MDEQGDVVIDDDASASEIDEIRSESDDEISVYPESDEEDDGVGNTPSGYKDEEVELLGSSARCTLADGREESGEIDLGGSSGVGNVSQGHGEDLVPLRKGKDLLESGSEEPDEGLVPQSEGTDSVITGSEEPVVALDDGKEAVGSIDGESDRFLARLVPLCERKPNSEFIEAVKSDPSLKQWRALADHKLHGLSWKNNMLVLSKFTDWNEFNDVLVVPQQFRKRILTTAHDQTGHL